LRGAGREAYNAWKIACNSWLVGESEDTVSKYTLILWKAPVVDDPDEAEALVKPYYEREDDSAFQPSADIAAVSNALRGRFPDAPWEQEQTDRLLVLHIPGDIDFVVGTIFELAREHELVLYDPQGPHVDLPGDLPPAPMTPIKLTRKEHLTAGSLFGFVGLAGALVFWLGWRIDVPVLDWLLMIIGGFFFTMFPFWLYIIMSGPKDESR
jgi:hypothetical protein